MVKEAQTKTTPKIPPISPPVTAPAATSADLPALIAAEVQRQLEAQRKRIGLAEDDALFLAYMAGFLACAHTNKTGDQHALEIFNRARGLVDKLRPLVAPPIGGS